MSESGDTAACPSNPDEMLIGPADQKSWLEKMTRYSLYSSHYLNLKKMQFLGYTSHISSASGHMWLVAAVFDSRDVSIVTESPF